MSERVRVSVARSGPLGLRDARAALFGWLLARSTDGSLLLRRHDACGECSPGPFEAATLEDLEWLGLEWEEPSRPAVTAGDPRSRSRTACDRILRELRASGAVYPCFCTPAAAGAGLTDDEPEHVSPGCLAGCRDVAENEARDRLASGEPAAWCLAVEPGREVTWTDRVRGRISWRAEALADFALARSDGSPLSDLVRLAGDIAMRVTLVVSDDDGVALAARQLLLREALRSEPPRFAHLPPIVMPEEPPPSGHPYAATVAGLREAGYLPEALIDHLARLGWSDPLGRPALTREELMAAFDLRRVSSEPVVHDPAALRTLNGRHLCALPTDRLVTALRPHLPPIPSWFDLAAFAEAVRGRIETAADAAPLAESLITAGPDGGGRTRAG